LGEVIKGMLVSKYKYTSDEYMWNLKIEFPGKNRK
jgi:hypothetical protein